MQKALRISIPEGWRFSNLQLSRSKATGDISFSIEALEQVVDPDDVQWLMTHNEEYLCDVLVRLYDIAVRDFGAEDATVETLIGEIRDEITNQEGEGAD